MDDHDNKKCFAVIVQVVIIYFAVTMLADFVMPKLLGSVPGLSGESRLTIAQLTAVIILTAYIIIKYKDTLRLTNKDMIFRLELPFIVLGVADVLVLSILTSNVVMHCLPADASLYDQRFDLPSGNMMIITIIWAVIAAPILEEIMCRGLIFKMLRAQHGFMLSAFISSLVWSVLHMSIIQGIIAFILGFLLALIMEKFDSLLICIATHMLNNCIAFLPFNRLNASGGAVIITAEILIMLLIVAGATLILIKHKVKIKKTALKE